MPTDHFLDPVGSLYLQSFEEEYARYPNAEHHYAAPAFWEGYDGYDCDSSNQINDLQDAISWCSEDVHDLLETSHSPKISLALVPPAEAMTSVIHHFKPYEEASTSSEKSQRIHKGEKRERARKKSDFRSKYNQMGLSTNLSPERLADLAEFMDLNFDASTSLTRFLRRHIAPEVDSEYLQAFDKRRRMITNDRYAIYNKMEKFQAEPGSMRLMQQTINYLIENGLLKLEDIASVEELEERTRGLKYAPYSAAECADAIQIYLAFQVGPDYGSYFNRLRRDYSRSCSLQ